MARPASGTQYLGDAQAFRDNAKTAEDLRLALAVLLPLEQGLSLQQTAALLASLAPCEPGLDASSKAHKLYRSTNSNSATAPMPTSRSKRRCSMRCWPPPPQAVSSSFLGVTSRTVVV